MNDFGFGVMMIRISWRIVWHHQNLRIREVVKAKIEFYDLRPLPKIDLLPRSHSDLRPQTILLAYFVALRILHKT